MQIFNYLWDFSYFQDGEGGLTLTHDEKGEVIHTTVVNEELPPMHKPKLNLKKPVRLIYCRPFTDEKPVGISAQNHNTTMWHISYMTMLLL